VFGVLACLAAASILLSACSSPTAQAQVNNSMTWVTGDYHTHTWHTGGKHAHGQVVENAFGKYGLDWMANSEHGGSYSTDPIGRYWDDPAMWRWQSLRDFSWPILFGGQDGAGNDQPGLQAKYQKQVLIQVPEWNVPTHEHAAEYVASRQEGYREDGDSPLAQLARSFNEAQCSANGQALICISTI
jgi:hypothetical protein